MSAIHDALKQSKNLEQHVSSNYNPLAQPSIAIKNTYGYWLVGILFLIATAAILLVPQHNILETSALITPVTESASQNKPVALTNENSTLENKTSQLSLVSETAQKPSDSQQEIVMSKVEPTGEQITDYPSIDKSKSIEVIQPFAEKSTIESVSVIIPAPKQKIQETEPLQIEEPIVEAKKAPELPIVKTTIPKPVKTTQATLISQSVSHWQNSVEHYISLGEVEKAEAELKKWIGVVPTDPVPHLWLARIYINNGFYRSAQPLLVKIKTADSLALQGVVHERLAEYSAAEKIFGQLYKQNQTNHKWLLFWAINAENAGQLAKSAKLYQNYLSLFTSEDAKLTEFAKGRLNILGGG